MYENRSIRQPEQSANHLDLARTNSDTRADDKKQSERTTLVLRNLMLWGSVAVSVGILYFLVALFL